MGSKSGNSGKPKENKKVNADNEGVDPVAEAKAIEAMMDREEAAKKAEKNRLAGLKGVGANNLATEAKTEEKKSGWGAKSASIPVNTKEVTVMETTTTTNQISEEVAAAKEPVMTPAQIQAARVQELMAGGMDMAEALAKVMAEAKPTSVPRQGTVDRLALMREENNIESLRKRIKIAFAKKSKGKGTAAEDKYLQEIQAGQARLNELLAEVNSADDPVAKAIELGESEGTILQSILQILEKEAEKSIEDIKAASKISAKALKEMITGQTTATPDTVSDRLNGYGDKFLALFNERAGKGDQRCMTINKKFQLIGSYVPATEEASSTPVAEETTEA